jgi:hypothetical protein
MMRPLACENSVEDISQVVSSLSCSVACYIKALGFGMLAGVLEDSLIAVVDRRYVAQRLQSITGKVFGSSTHQLCERMSEAKFLAAKLKH